MGESTVLIGDWYARADAFIRSQLVRIGIPPLQCDAVAALCLNICTLAYRRGIDEGRREPGKGGRFDD